MSCVLYIYIYICVYMMWYDMKWNDMIYDIWYMIYDVWCMMHDIWYMIWYGMVCMYIYITSYNPCVLLHIYYILLLHITTYYYMSLQMDGQSPPQVDHVLASRGQGPSQTVLLKEHHVELVVLRLREEGPYRAIVVVVRLVGALVSSLGTPWWWCSWVCGS